MQAVLVSADLEQPDEATTSTSAGGDTCKVELSPLPGLSQQFAMHVEWEIQKQIKERSHKLVQEVLQRYANQIMPPTSSEAARAFLSQCFQKALATPRTKPALPMEQPKGQTKEAPAQYSVANPFVGINPPPPDILTGERSDQPIRGRTTQKEKKRRSSSHPRGEAEPKRGQSSGAEPSWNASHIGGRQSDKALEPTLKLKSIVKMVRMNLPKPEDLESLGLAARSRYDDSSKDNRARRDRSQHWADASVHPKDVHHGKPRSGTANKGSSHSESGFRRHDQRSGQSPDLKVSKHKEESLGAKLLAHKEHEKKIKKIVDNPMLYLEECQHQILPEEHKPEIDSL